MAEIPHAVLSERLQTHMKGRRLRSGVFLTYCFEPGFFEQEILPVFVDVPLSQSAELRLAQLEDVIKSRVDHLAVYYDAEVLVPGAHSAKLDIRRIPVAHRTGAFHPKNVLLLVEETDSGADATPRQHLIVATLSANLSRAGWWENVEVCHIEEVPEDGSIGFRADLLELLTRIRKVSPEGSDHSALDAIRAFVRRVEPRSFSRMNDVLYPRLYTGESSVPDFLDEVLGDRLRGLNLEIISPFFDEVNASPLRALIERFDPAEVRVLLPWAADGSAQCLEDYYDAVRAMTGVRWGQLPTQLQRMGKSENAATRRVHAKLYRFFDPKRRYEAMLVGSVNLTSAAHSRGGNFETAFLVETDPARVPDWWLATDSRRPTEFKAGGEDATPSHSPGSALTVRYEWNTGTAEVLWNAATPSPPLRISGNDIHLFSLAPLPAGRWQDLGSAEATALRERLPSSSFLTVLVDGAEPAVILVQEEGMSHKPSLFMSLSAADILRYWALLTPEQRAAFIERHFEAMSGQDTSTDPRMRRLAEPVSIFSSFAGVFHAFSSLEKAVLAAIEAGREKDAVYRMFGRKYDSLHHLLDRVVEHEKESDPLVRYVIVLCARQLIAEVRHRAPGFALTHTAELTALTRRLADAAPLRDQLGLTDSDESDRFLDWFERWFLARAEQLTDATT